jgi:S-adenosylmethionine uptake transporter
MSRMSSAEGSAAEPGFARVARDPRGPQTGVDRRLTRASPSVLTGIALAASGYSLFSLQDATVKWLVASYPTPEILFVRSSVIVLVALLVGRGGPVLRDLAGSRNKVPLLARGSLILTAWLLFYSASAHMGLAEITTLYFAAPVIAVVLSALILKEKVSAARWGAVASGFLGVAVAAGPMTGLSLGPAAAALTAAACWGTGTILVRLIGRTDSTLVQVLSSNAIFVLGAGLSLPWLWHTPSLTDFGLMILLGLIGGLGQFLLFEGYRFAPASALAPVEYTGLIWAGFYGYLIWADVPGASTLTGAALILTGSLWLVWAERQRSLGRSRAAELT